MFKQRINFLTQRGFVDYSVFITFEGFTEVLYWKRGLSTVRPSRKSALCSSYKKSRVVVPDTQINFADVDSYLETGKSFFETLERRASELLCTIYIFIVWSLRIAYSSLLSDQGIWYNSLSLDYLLGKWIIGLLVNQPIT